VFKYLGCKVIGSAGGPDKVKFLKEIGCDGVIDYKSENTDERLKALSPDGYDIYFDNVGGETLDIVLS
jgi:NADPH-dependent curcumin reductase CurA